MRHSVPWRWPRWRATLRQRVRLVVTVLVSLLVSIAVVAVATGSRVDRETADIADRLLPALAVVSAMDNAFREQAVAQRDYVLSGLQSVRQTYDAAAATATAASTDLSTSLAGQPAVQARLGIVERAYEQWLQRASRPAMALVAEGRAAEALTIIAPGGLSGQLYAPIRDGVVQLRLTLWSLVAAATARVSVAQNTVSWTVRVALAAGVVITLITLLGLRRMVTRPLADLVARVSAVAGGELDRPLSVRGPAEFTDIGAAVEQMRQQLAQHTRQAVAAQHRATKSSESERIAADLRENVIERLFATGVTLTSLAARAPGQSAALLATVHDLDQVSDQLRRVIFDLNLEGGQPYGLRRQIIDMVSEVERDLGFTPMVDINGPLDTAVDSKVADELVAVARKALSVLSLGHSPGRTAIRLAATDHNVRLLARRDGTGPPGPDRPVGCQPAHDQLVPGDKEADEKRWAEIITRATNLGGTCTVRHDNRGGIVLDWSVPISGDQAERAAGRRHGTVSPNTG